jgi:hypothetical protein
MRRGCLLAVVLLLCLCARAAHADDAGDASSCSADLTSDPNNCGQCGTACISDACVNSSCVPLACDGGLCDTTNQSQCDVGAVGAGVSSTAALGVFAALLALVLLRRRAIVVAGMLAMTNVVHAEPPKAVDVVIKEQPPPRRYVSIAWNPVPAFALGKASFDVVIAPVNHHALVLSPFYASTSTAPFWVYNDAGQPTALPKQGFEGWGGEIGYRYYFGLGGPRGFFLGGSFLIGAFTATPQIGSAVHYLNLGGALDVGYQMLVADRIVVAAGLGAQYTTTDKTIPNQQFPAKVYANSGFNPRLLVSLGCVF